MSAALDKIQDVVSHGPITFRRFTLSDLDGFAEGLIAEKVVATKQLAKEEKLSKNDEVNLLLQVKTQRPGLEEYLAHANSPGGARRLLHKSLCLAGNKNADAIIDMIAPYDGVLLVKELILEGPVETKEKNSSEVESNVNSTVVVPSTSPKASSSNDTDSTDTVSPPTKAFKKRTTN